MCWKLLPAALLFVAGACAQSRQEPLIKISVDLVQIDAVVTDSKGKHVTGLTREDFEIYEDGQKKDVTSFTWVGEPAGSPASPHARLRPEDVQRTIAILPTSGGMGALQQFTTDKRLLLAAASRLRHPGFGRAGVSSFQPLDNRRPSNLPDLGGRAIAERTAGDEAMRQWQEEIFAAGTLGALSLTIRSLRDLPGREYVVLTTSPTVRPSSSTPSIPRDSTSRE